MFIECDFGVYGAGMVSLQVLGSKVQCNGMSWQFLKLLKEKGGESQCLDVADKGQR